MTAAPAVNQADPHDVHAMTCMEIWGGTGRSSQRVDTPGMDVHVYSEPYRGEEAGGDIHFVSTCGMGNLTRLLLADVAGHGEVVSELSGKLRQLLKRHIHNLDNSDFARALNEEFGDVADGGRFATAVIATYFAPTDQLVVVNAGHPRPLWHSRAAGGWRLLDDEGAPARDGAPENLPLGIIGGTNYRQFVVNLAPGDRIVLYSDALAEAAAPSGAQLGEAGLLDAARRVDDPDVEKLSERLRTAVEDHRGQAPADDDATVLAIHHTGGKAPRPSLGDRLTVLAQMVGLMPVRNVSG